MTIVVLRHVECEPAADYGTALAHIAPIRTIDVGVDELPPLETVQAILSMGGPMGVADMDRLPWIADEIAYLADAVDRDIPVWGVCLGAQLLAAALGAKVYTGDAPEVGVGKVALTAAGSLDAVWGSMGPELSVVQWHSDTFELPEGAVHLASSDKYAHQLFRYGRSYGVQFHLEAPADLVAEWADIPEYRASLTEALGAEGVAILAQTMNEVADQIHENATDAIRGWSRLWS